MPMRDNLALLLGVVKDEFSVFAEKAHKAAIGGAQALSENLRETADELLPETSIVIEKIKTALQSSAAVAGEQLKSAGEEFLQAIRSSGQK